MLGNAYGDTLSTAYGDLAPAAAELLERAVQVGHQRSFDRPEERYGGLDVPAYLRRYYRHVPIEDLVGRDPADLFGAALSHWQLARSRAQGTALVRAFNPSVEEHGWSSGHTVVEVVTDDMPFLVDSVTGELTRQGRAIHAVVHPVMPVRRDVTGALQAVDTAAGDGASSDTAESAESAESWMHVEIDRETDRQRLDEVAAALTRVLRDVREAVEDWPKMSAAVLRVADELQAQPPVGVPAEEVAEGAQFLRWLADDHFTFLGYREYALPRDTATDADAGAGVEQLRAVPGTGLGILRDDQPASPTPPAVSPQTLAKDREPRLLVLTKANSRSTVHRNAYLDYVGVRSFDASGAVVAERRFLGLYTSGAYNESVRRIPVLRRTVAEVLARTGFPTDSHSGKDLLTILETYPRDELFQTSAQDLEPVVLSVLHLQERRRLRLFLRADDYGRFVSCLVYLPRDRYTTQVRRAMEELLRSAYAADTVDYAALVSESVLARLHFVVRMAPGATIPEVDAAELEARLVEATRSWVDDFADALVASLGEEEGGRLLRSYGEAYPEAYKEDFPPRTAVADLRRLDALTPGALGMNLYSPFGAGPGQRRFKLFCDCPLSLTRILPIMQELGVEVLDERPYELVRRDGARRYLYDFGLHYAPADDEGLDPQRADEKERFQDAFAAVWSGQAESDGFNTLVLRAGLSWRQAAVLRAYGKYLRQAGTTFSQDYLEQALIANVGIARLLVALFEARFDPAYGDAGDRQRTERADALLGQLTAALDAVASLDQDRILRSFLALVRATLRTNHYVPDPAGNPKSYLAVKLDPTAVPDLPQPRPRFEIWVYSPRVEGVHLRFGPVARGGLRWSDRREDFRTEVLGLVKAQVVKNAVIVPTGAKGGFVVKQPPADPTDRAALQAEAVACYTTFISGLLDVTDNLRAGAVEPPPAVVRTDGDDAYLVVAADKGTATFSDLANRVSADYGFWLGDAFASGGSAGYDHKAMGITARGAWESVKRHFRELGVDVQGQEFTAVGIGDMSGDVFGNGMLLSEHVRLIAAFDHRHVFLDPDPDPARSYAERRRLFDLPRSSWADYDLALLSAGGGVYPRTAKSIPVSPEVRAALGLPDEVATATPAELMRAVLTAPVDLLWNGGIGTYVKAAGESHAQVGDKANDAIRVDGAQVRARVVGEGGNLGLTQLGRIEYALVGADGAGGRVNTDAIDNSAGVDTSDHEVNIKILLDEVVRDGDLTDKQRNALLAEMTEDVARLVLRDNYEQNVLLGNARSQAPDLLPVHRRLMSALEKKGELDRGLEFLPNRAGLDARAGAGGGLTSPELAVLVAYSKITTTKALLASELPDEPWFRRSLRSYFPPEIAQRYGERLDQHPLRREIVTTVVVNDLVNRGGITFAFRAGEETSAAPAELARAYTVAREVFGFERYWAAIEALDNKISTRAQTALYLEGRRLLDRSVRWLLQSRRAALDVAGEVARFTPDVSALAARVPDLLLGAEKARLHARAVEYEALGVPGDLALHAAGLLDSFSLLDVVQTREATGRPAQEVAEVYFTVSERFGIDALLTRITALPRDDRWQALARSALRYDLYAALAALTADVLTETPPLAAPAARLDAWERANAEGLARARGTLDEVLAGDAADLATLSVSLRSVRTLLSTAAGHR